MAAKRRIKINLLDNTLIRRPDFDEPIAKPSIDLAGGGTKIIRRIQKRISLCFPSL